MSRGVSGFVSTRLFAALSTLALVGFVVTGPSLMRTASAVASAATTKHTRTTTTTTVDSDEDGADVSSTGADVPSSGGFAPPADAVAAPANMPSPAHLYTESELTQTFGSKAVSGMAGCKTEKLSKDVIKDLKHECSTWVAEQKSDLGKNYLGNTCEDSCDDCGMSLVRCKVTGTVRYKKKQADD